MCAEQAEDRVCENADTKHQLMIIIIKQNAASTKQIIQNVFFCFVCFLIYLNSLVLLKIVLYFTDENKFQ